MRRSIAAVGAVSLAIVYGCAAFSGEDNPSPGPGPSTDGAVEGGDGPIVVGKPTVAFSIEAPSRVFAGDKFEVVVTIARSQGAYTGPMRFELLAPTPGVAMDPVEVNAGETSARFSASTTADRKHGSVPFELVATSIDGQHKGSAKTILGVRGRPGDLDTSFATNGVFDIAENSEASAISIRPPPGSEIVVGARLGSGVGLLRLKPDGLLDSSFATAGTLRASPSGEVVSTSNIETNYLGVTINTAGTSRGSVFRFRDDGTILDEGGNGGFTDFPVTEATAVMALPQGSGAVGLVVGGRRLATDGDLFLAFAGAPATWGDGNRTLTVPSDCVAADKSACATESLLLHAAAASAGFLACAHRGPGAGSTVLETDPVGQQRTITSTTGKLDRCTAIGKVGFNVFLGGNAWGTPLAGVFQHLALSGSTWNPQNVTNPGVAEAPAGSGLTMAKRLAVTTSSITVVSDATLAGRSVIGLWRILPDGKTDITFGNGKGYVVQPVGQGDAVVRSMALDNDGRPVVVGSAGGKLFVARFWN